MHTTLESTQVGSQVVTTVRRIDRDGTEHTEIVSACEELCLQIEDRGHELVLERPVNAIQRKAANRKRYERQYARRGVRLQRVFRRIDGSVDQYLG